MAGLENLFSTDPELPQCVTTKLPDNPGEWSEIITTRIRELYPDVARLPLSIEYRKKDDQAGTAIGAVHVISTEASKSVHLPIIIKKFELFPIDVWMEGDTQAVHPLTPDTFKEQFFLQTNAESLDTRPTDAAGSYFNDPSTWNTNYPPLQGRYSYASAGYPILDAISDTMTQADLDAFRSLLEQEASTLPNFKKHGHWDILKKLAAKQGKSFKDAKATPDGPNVPLHNNFRAAAIKLIPRSIASLKRAGNDSYSVLASADRLFDLAGTEDLRMSREECGKWVSKICANPEAFMNEVDQDGEKMLIHPDAPRNTVFLFDDVRDVPESANEFATYRVRTLDGLGVEGLVFPHVVDFKGKKLPYKLFISQKNSTMQNDIAGAKVVDSDEFQKVFFSGQTGAARVGQTGTFVYVDDGKAIATEPVTIKSVEEYGPLTAVTLQDKKIKISRGYPHHSPKDIPSAETPEQKKLDAANGIHYLDVHGMIEQHPDQYVIPRKMLWIPMEGFRDLASTPNEWLQKEAGAKMAARTPTSVLYTGVVYELNGNGLERFECNERMAKHALAVQGASVEDATRIVKLAKTKGRVQAYGLSPLRDTSEFGKEAAADWAMADSYCKLIRPTDPALMLKVASYLHFKKTAASTTDLEDSATVDSILALNFANPENISKFVSYRPVLQKVCDALAELVMASRLGLTDIPESACVVAMNKLHEVVHGLMRMEAGLLKAPAQKIAADQSEKGNAHSEFFADGMVDGELKASLHLHKAHAAGPEAMLSYLRGKRMSEVNQIQAKQSTKPAKPIQPVKKK